MFQCFNVSLKQMDGLGFLRGFYAIYVPASEIFFFEIVDGRTTTDACLSYKLTCEPLAQVS